MAADLDCGMNRDSDGNSLELGQEFFADGDAEVPVELLLEQSPLDLLKGRFGEQYNGGSDRLFESLS